MSSSTWSTSSFDPTLSKLHRQVLDLLNVPATAYQAERETAQ
jgi:hypothetical protein